MNNIQILLVEDNEGDILLVTEALEEAKLLSDLHVTKDGSAAIRFLENANGYTKSPSPDLILLDINLPKRNGHEVLQYVKNSEKLKQIPVIMLTTSSTPNDILEAYKHYANCYITKPVGGQDFLQVINKIQEFWFTVVQLPQKA